jgi:hypothetical protein
MSSSSDPSTNLPAPASNTAVASTTKTSNTSNAVTSNVVTSGTTATSAATSASSHSVPPLLSIDQIITSPSGVKLHLVIFNSTEWPWPADLILDLDKSNWLEWSRRLSLLALSHGLKKWLDGSFPCPDEKTADDAHFVWMRNDGVLRALIQSHVSLHDAHAIELLPTSHLMFEKLRSIHGHRLQLLLKALQIRFSHDTPFRDTLAEVETIANHIIAMGQLSDDDIRSMLILNALNKNFGPLQCSIISLVNSPNFSSEMIAKHVLDEDASMIWLNSSLATYRTDLQTRAHHTKGLPHFIHNTLSV